MSCLYVRSSLTKKSSRSTCSHPILSRARKPTAGVAESHLFWKVAKRFMPESVLKGRQAVYHSDIVVAQARGGHPERERKHAALHCVGRDYQLWQAI